MRILQVCAYAAQYEGNFMKSLYELDSELEKMGHETMYAFPISTKNFEWVNNLQKRRTVFFLPLRNARINPKTYIQIYSIIKKNNIDLVHSHFELYDLPISSMAPKNVKVFWHLHDAIYDNESTKNRFLRLIQYNLFNRNSKMVSVAEYYRLKAIELGMPKKQTVTLLNCLDLTRLDKLSYVSDDKKYEFLIFGWDFHRKGGDLILSACELLHKEGYEFKLLFNGNEQTWKALNECLNGEKPEWLILGDPVENINELYCKSKSLISASRKETFSYAVCEAVYCGLPVVSSDIAGLEWAKKIKTVSMFENENIEQLTNLMRKLLTTDFKIEKTLVEESQNTIEKEYSISSWVNKLIKIYEV